MTADRFITSHLKTIESETKILRSIQIENRNQYITTYTSELSKTNSVDVRFKEALTANNELNNNQTEVQNFSKNSIPNNNGYEDIEIEDDFAHYTISKDKNER